MFRVPLVLERSIAVVYRLNPSATRDVQPYTGQTSGYDPDFKEPIAFDDQRLGRTERAGTRSELPPVRIPCQVEPATFEALRQFPQGDMPDSSIILVLHRRDLAKLKLLDAQTGKPLLRRNDRVARLESSRRAKKTKVPLEGDGLFIHSVAPGSFGFGPDGHDLHLVYLNERERAAR